MLNDINSNIIKEVSLCDIKKGQTVFVCDLLCNGAKKQRLKDLGINKGARLNIKRVAPFGDPLVLAVNDCDIAIRKSDAKEIFVRQGC